MRKILTLIAFLPIALLAQKLPNQPSSISLGSAVTTATSNQEEAFEFGKKQRLGKAPCKYDQLKAELFAKDPKAKEAFDLNNAQILKIVQRMEAERSQGNEKAALITIPIVFHIMHIGEAVGQGANISNAQVLSAVDALNRDYRRTAADGGIAQGAGPDIEVEFCLASIDPNGNATTGINRINTSSIAGYSTTGIDESANGAAVKALSSWPTADYVNIWVVREIDNEGEYLSWGGGTLGYAYPVSGSPTNNPNTNPSFNSLDGIVALYFSVGNLPSGTNPDFRLLFNLNRTLTHEMGHHLNLQHPFEGGSCTEGNCATEGDYVCDTPPTILNSNCSAPACGNTQQVDNYMDYTGEDCANRFSVGQKTRMRAVLEGFSRSSLANSAKCGAANNLDVSLDAIIKPDSTSCTKSLSPIVIIRNRGANTLTSLTIKYNVDGATDSIFNWTGNLNTTQPDTVQLPVITASTGVHIVNFELVNPNGGTDENLLDNTGSASTTVSAGTGIELSIVLDCFGSETRWEVKTTGNALVGSGGPFLDGTETEVIKATGCLSDGCYKFTITDSFGDGLAGGARPACGIDGDYYIIDDLGNTLGQMTQADFGNEASFNFCLPYNVNQIIADFSATPTVALVGQNVQFTDLSTGTPAATTYAWTFGDGGTDNIANPTHAYSTVGAKSVKLIVSNGFTTDSITKTITVIGPLGPCDTLTNILPSDNITFYNLGTNLGYFPGNSAYDLSSFVDKYSVSAPITIKRLRVPVAMAFATNTTNTVRFVVYNDVAGLPGTKLGQQAVPLSSLAAGFYNDVIFTTPVNVSGTFYLGFEIDNPSPDTLAIFTAVNRGVGAPKSLYVLAAGTWRDANDLFTPGGMTTSLAIEALFSDIPTAIGTLSDSSICVGNQIQFQSSSTNADSIEWTFPSGSPASSTAAGGILSYANAGNYTATLVAYGECSQTDTNRIPVLVTTVPMVNAAATPNPVDLANGGVVMFSNTGATASSYKWNFGDSQTSTIVPVNHTYTTVGIYKVALTGTNAGCSFTDSVTVVVTSTIGIGENQQESISLYPNPAQQFITISTPAAIKKISLINALGQEVKVTSSADHKEIVLSNVSPGIYILQITTSSGTISKKIQITK